MQSPQSPSLIRSLGLFSAFVITVSAVIGSGIYKKVAPMSEELGSSSLVLWCWVLAGVITLFGALSNAEIASMLADSGGEYVYFKKIYNKFFAFIFGWSGFFVIRSASLASIAYVFAQSFNMLVPLPQLPPEMAGLSVLGIFTPFDNFGVKLLAILLMFLLTGVNIVGLKTSEGLSRAALILVTISILLVIVLGLTMGGGSWDNITAPSVRLQDQTRSSGGLIQSMFIAMLAAFWAYEGWSTTGYLGGEIKNPNRNLPLALVLGVLFVIAVYVSVNFTYLYVMPIDHIIDVSKSTNQIAAIEVVRSFLGGGGALFISLLILLTTFMATNSTVLPPPRLYYAMAKDGLFFSWASYIHPRFHTPSKALIAQAVWSALLVLSGSFDQLTDMLVFGSFIFYGATTVGVFVLRVKMPDAPRPYKAFGYPVVPAIFVLFCIVLIAVTIIGKPREAFLGLGLMLTGLPFYWWWTKGKG